jgi:hypothetical protein
VREDDRALGVDPGRQVVGRLNFMLW